MKNKNKKAQKKPPLKRIRAPKGFSFRISQEKNHYDYDYKKGPSYVEINLYDSSYPYETSIGGITLERFNETTFETHSHLNNEYHGRGLGTLMYARAIQWCLANGYKARSSSSPSEYAQRVWKSKGIRKIYRLRKRESRWGGCNVWHAYRK